MIRKLFITLFLFANLSLQKAQATTAYYVTDKEQAELSSAVVVATIGSSVVKKHPSYKSIMTQTYIGIDEVLYGTAPSQVQIRQIGGTLDGKTLYLPGDARFKEGEKCVLFLHEKNGLWYLTAMEQSKYSLRYQKRLGWVMERNLSEGIVIRNSAGSLIPYEEPSEKPIKRLIDFKKQLKNLQTGGVK